MMRAKIALSKVSRLLLRPHPLSLLRADANNIRRLVMTNPFSCPIACATGPGSIIDWNHTTIVFNLPEGQGQGKSFEVAISKLGRLGECEGKSLSVCHADRWKESKAQEVLPLHFILGALPSQFAAVEIS